MKRGISGFAQVAESAGAARRRRVIAEIGRDEHEPRECRGQISDRSAQREAAAGGKSKQREMSRQILSPQLRNQIVQVVIKLSVIADVAAGAGSAMTSDVGNDDKEVFRRQLLGDAVHPVE